MTERFSDLRLHRQSCPGAYDETLGYQRNSRITKKIQKRLRNNKALAAPIDAPVKKSFRNRKNNIKQGRVKFLSASLL